MKQRRRALPTDAPAQLAQIINHNDEISDVVVHSLRAFGVGAGATVQLDAPLGKVVILTLVESFPEARIRAYGTKAGRDLDAARAWGDPWPWEWRVIFDAQLPSGGSWQAAQILANTEPSRSAQIYFALTNLSSSTADVVVDLHHSIIEP